MLRIAGRLAHFLDRLSFAIEDGELLELRTRGGGRARKRSPALLTSRKPSGTAVCWRNKTFGLLNVNDGEAAGGPPVGKKCRFLRCSSAAPAVRKRRAESLMCRLVPELLQRSLNCSNEVET